MSSFYETKVNSFVKCFDLTFFSVSTAWIQPTPSQQFSGKKYFGKHGN
jgi:hypothetical protein